VGQVGPVKYGLDHAGPAESRSSQLSIREIGPREIRAVEPGTTEVGVAKICFTQVSPSQVGVLQVDASEGRANRRLRSEHQTMLIDHLKRAKMLHDGGLAGLAAGSSPTQIHDLKI
jgi:hypothetical protein